MPVTATVVDYVRFERAGLSVSMEHLDAIDAWVTKREAKRAKGKGK